MSDNTEPIGGPMKPDSTSRPRLSVPTFVGVIVAAAALLLGGCSSDTALTDASALPTSTADTTTSSTAVPSTTVEPTVPTTVTPAVACAGVTSIPLDARVDQTISGDADGATGSDVVTVYSANDGTPHVFLESSAGTTSDVALPLGYADTVAVSFESIDFTNGANPQFPDRILAIGAGQAGSAFATILWADETPLHCLQQWTVSDSPFVFMIDQRGPYSGMFCDGLGGKIHYTLQTATPDGAGHLNVIAQEITHVGPAVTLTDWLNETVAETPESQHFYGDIQNCLTAPILP